MPADKTTPRRHASRTCQTCKRGKRRCELPPESRSLPATGHPLPDYQSCVRCRRMSVPCVLDETRRASTPKPSAQLMSPASSTSGPGSASTTGSKAVPSMTLHTHPQNIQDYENYFHRHLPLSIIRDFHQRTQRPDAPVPSGAPIESLISEAQAEAVAEWCDSQILLWLPFLPSATSLRHLRNSSFNSPSLRFLECAQYLIAAQFGAINLDPAKAHEIRGICRDCLADTLFAPLDDFAPVVLVMTCTLTVEGAGTSDAGAMGLLARQCTMRKTGDLSLSDRILEVITATWQCVSVVGDDDLIHQARAHRSLVLPTPGELEQLLEDIEKQRNEFSETNRNGAVGAVLRCRSWVMARETIEAISRLDPGDEDKQLAALQEVKDNWTAAIRPHITRCRQLITAPSLLSWLEVEMHALDSIVCDSILHYSLGTRWTPRYIFGLSRGELGSRNLQEFVADKHGPAASNAAQSLLAALTNLPGPSEYIYPAPLTCAYILKAALTGVEVHASSFKLWQSQPAREAVWTSLLRSVQDMTEKLKGGSTVPMTISVMTTIRDTISKWKAELGRPSVLADPTWVSLGGPSVCPVLQSLEELMSTIDWDHLVM